VNVDHSNYDNRVQATTCATELAEVEVGLPTGINCAGISYKPRLSFSF
jgi:hypothetical protein